MRQTAVALFVIALITSAHGQHRFEPMPESTFDWKPFGQGVRAVAIGDVDNDGWPDAFAASVHDVHVALLQNEGASRFADVAWSMLTVDVGDFWVGGPAFGDYDNDGDLDLFLGREGANPTRVWPVVHPDKHLLLRNDRGLLHDVTAEAGLADVDLPEYDSPIRSLGPVASWFDYDRDGSIDLYVASLGADRLYRNRGDGTFEDVTTAAGLADVASVGGIGTADYNGDRWPDLYLSVAAGSNRLFLNDGAGAFVDATTDLMATTQYSWGTESGDIDGDGDTDIVLANLLNHPCCDPWEPEGVAHLYVNAGDGANWSRQEGFGVGGFISMNLEDTDGDGDLDIHAIGFPAAYYLFENRGADGFAEISSALDGIGRGLAIALADLDLDGAQDLIFGDRPYRNEVLVNHWLQVDLVGTQSNRDAIGARTTLVAGDLRSVRELTGGAGPHQEEGVLHFGLDIESFADSLIIDWPSGARDVLVDLVVDRRIRVIEGTGEAFDVVPSRSIAAPPETLQVGVPVTFTVSVQPALFEPTAAITAASYDLNGVADATQLGMVDAGDGTFSIDVEVTPQRSGVFNPGALIEQSTSLGPQWVRIGCGVTVLPRQDLPVYTDGLEPGWTFRGESAEFLEADTADPFHGTASASTVVGGEWIYHLESEAPVSDAGYQSVRMALRLGDLELPAEPFLHLWIPGGWRVNLHELVDLEDTGWHTVDVPVERFFSRSSLSRLTFVGNFSGTVELDDIRFISEIQANTAVTETFDDGTPEAFALDPSYPNPFNSGTVIPFRLPAAGRVGLAVYDLLGQRVTTLASGWREAGSYRLRWDGRGDDGRTLASGVYVVRATAGAHVLSRKVTLLR